MAARNKPEKKQHIQVFTRVRPLSSQELRSQVVVECISSKEVSVRDKSQTKTFTFDRVFGPDSKQVDVYKAVVSPLISEVLQGYNCTVFAYGQTGTGKTFTMVGEKSGANDGSWEDDPSCGVIPRTLSHLFDELKVRADEFTVRVSFLELYNEELCDLLAPNVNDDGKNLKLFEDSMKKGSVIVSGLEERTVHNKDDVYAILEAGNLRRQTAPTLMNAQSSRSHTIFTITVHIKVTTPEGEDLIKTGKLNLVDLAGSENIGRSGAVEMRAREAGSINQSLLTLGRVITSLVERTPHVPYRESKLTRILQDSLGGRTKTSIIATVSPALCNIEETLSTFDYAHRARNITNKPEINQKTSKRVLLKEYTEEIERLRRDLIATREKHGVYLASENYNAIIAEKENLNKELVSKLQLLKVREDELVKQEEILKSLNMNLYATQNELQATCQKLQEANKLCSEKENMLHELGKQTNALLKTADEAVNDAKRLHDRLDRSRRIIEHNFNSAEKFKNKFCWHLGDMKTRTKNFLENGISQIESQLEADKTLVSSIKNNQLTLKNMINSTVTEMNDKIKSAMEVLNDQTTDSQTFLNEQLNFLKSTVDAQNENAHQIISNLTTFSGKMNSNWSMLINTIEQNKNIILEQCCQFELIQQNLTKLTEMALALPVIYNEKLKQREEVLKSYVEKCDFLEKKQTTMRKQMEEFGHNLYKMAQDHVQLLQRENECEEALRNVRNDRKCAEESQFTEIMSSLEKNSGDMNSALQRTIDVNDKMSKSTAELLRVSTDVVFPLVNDVATTTHNWTLSMEAAVNENRSSLEAKVIESKNLCEAQIEKLQNFATRATNQCNGALKNVNNLLSCVNDNTKSLNAMVDNTLEKNTETKHVMSAHMSDFSNEIMSKLEERTLEIDTFIHENIKRDEKTGNTPQRKEFNYPKTILCYSNRLSGSTRQEEFQKNITDFVNEGEAEDTEDDSVNSFEDNKENISLS